MIDRSGHIRAESARLGAVLARTDASASVPTCPEWTARDLLAHVVRVHDFWAHVIGDRLTGPQVGEYEKTRPELPAGRDELLRLLPDATSRLLAALEARDPADPAWSWFPPDQTVAFTWRMQTHEVTMHRVDAELAAGEPIGAISTEVAADGVDHVVEVMWGWVPADAHRTVVGTLELRATDIDRTWRLRALRWDGEAWGETFTGAPGLERDDSTGDPDAVVTGTAEALDLLAWTRAGARGSGESGGGVGRSGDERVLGVLQAVLDDGIG